ncbi:MAG: hypothetical protein HY562_03780 [Ignavibacteriales bacterium]|nr:hypothetical protein [Ignavibacteriales bacterium]
MKRHLVLLAGLLFAVTATVYAQKKSEKEVTVKGEVVDIACYVMGGAKGDDHKACAEACAKAGGSLGILTADGKLYVSLLPDDHKKGPNAILMDHISHSVEATGYVRTSGGVQGIMIKSVKMAM